MGDPDLVLWQLRAHYIEKFAVIWRMFLAKRFLSGKLEKYHDASGVGRLWRGMVGGDLCMLLMNFWRVRRLNRDQIVLAHVG